VGLIRPSGVLNRERTASAPALAGDDEMVDGLSSLGHSGTVDRCQRPQDGVLPGRQRSCHAAQPVAGHSALHERLGPFSACPRTRGPNNGPRTSPIAGSMAWCRAGSSLPGRQLNLPAIRVLEDCCLLVRGHDRAASNDYRLDNRHHIGNNEAEAHAAGAGLRPLIPGQRIELENCARWRCSGEVGWTLAMLLLGEGQTKRLVEAPGQLQLIRAKNDEVDLGCRHVNIIPGAASEGRPIGVPEYRPATSPNHDPRPSQFAGTAHGTTYVTWRVGRRLVSSATSSWKSCVCCRPETATTSRDPSSRTRHGSAAVNGDLLVETSSIRSMGTRLVSIGARQTTSPPSRVTSNARRGP